MNHIQSKLRGHPLANFLLNDFYLDKKLDFYFLFEGLYSASKQSKCVHKRSIRRRFGLNFLLEGEIKLKRLLQIRSHYEAFQFWDDGNTVRRAIDKYELNI